MMAEKMFKKLGYKMDINMLGIIKYSKHDDDIDYYVRFYCDLGIFDCNCVINKEIVPMMIDRELLNAINKQVEELE